MKTQFTQNKQNLTTKNSESKILSRLYYFSTIKALVILDDLVANISKIYVPETAYISENMKGITGYIRITS